MTSHTKQGMRADSNQQIELGLLGGGSVGTVGPMTTPLVLLVDDNEGNQDLMALYLEGLPVRCVVVKGLLNLLPKVGPTWSCLTS